MSEMTKNSYLPALSVLLREEGSRADSKNYPDGTARVESHRFHLREQNGRFEQRQVEGGP